MKSHGKCAKILLVVCVLATLSGCTADDVIATTGGLAGDLVRQLLAFWLL